MSLSWIKPVPSPAQRRRCKCQVNIVSANCHDPQVLFKTINSILRFTQVTSLESVRNCSTSFLARALIPSSSYDPSIVSCSVVLTQFDSASLSMKPSGTPIEAIPPHHLKEGLPSVGSSSILQSYRSINQSLNSKPFLSKIWEKLVFLQLNTFLDWNDILEVFQSGFKT